MNKIRNIDDIKSGYIVILRNGDLYMCMRYDQDNFNKVFVNEHGYQKCLYNGLNHKWYRSLDIVKVYGLVDDNCKYEALHLSTENRPLLYIEKKKMTISEIEKKTWL